MAKHNEIGKYGEDIAAKWCLRNGFVILDRNYLKKYGEIDIVARGTSGIVHFIEVKSVSYETKTQLNASVSHGTWRPEENVHRDKQRKFMNTISAWLAEHRYDGKWQIDIFAVRMVPREKFATIKRLENVIFE
jgi:Holliday junction resolvase-like predicted endonuclease